MHKFKITLFVFILITICFYFVNFSFAFNQYIWSNYDLTSTTSSSINNTADENNNSLSLESESAILIEQKTGQILYSHNMHNQLRPASVTKVMSLLLIMEEIDSGKLSLSDQIPCSQNASSMGGSQIWLDPKETLSVSDMLKAICVVSANDCVVAMAEYIAGSEEAFVEMMNEKAKELGMNDTCFKNCHGIDEDGHVTSSYDISLMSMELLNNHPQITEYTTIWMDSLRDGKSELVNTNKLVRNYKGATGLKTGSTSLALFNLSASATRDDLSLIAVVMKAPSSSVRFSEAEKLLNYGFSNFSFKQFAKKGDTLKKVNVQKGVTPQVTAVFEEDCGVLIKKGQDKNISQEVILNDNISAPIYKDQILGEVKFYLNDEQISTCNIIASENIDKLNIFTMCKQIYSSWFTLLRT